MQIGRRPAIAIVVVVVVLIFSGTLDWMLDMAFNPWARATPPIFGAWTGTLTAGNGERLIVSLEMQRALSRDEMICIRCAQIEGTAATCDARGTVLRYHVSGSPTDR